MTTKCVRLQTAAAAVVVSIPFNRYMFLVGNETLTKGGGRGEQHWATAVAAAAFRFCLRNDRRLKDTELFLLCSHFWRPMAATNGRKFCRTKMERAAVAFLE